MIDNLEDLNLALSNHQEFKRLIKTAGDLVEAGRQFPTQADQLIRPLLTDPEEFKRLIKTASDLVVAGRQFPTQAEIFQQPSVEAALNTLNTLNNIAKAKAYTKGATIGALAGGELSKNLPPEVASHVGSFLSRKQGSNLAQTRKDAHKTATEEEQRQSTLRKK